MSGCNYSYRSWDQYRLLVSFPSLHHHTAKTKVCTLYLRNALCVCIPTQRIQRNVYKGMCLQRTFLQYEVHTLIFAVHAAPLQLVLDYVQQPYPPPLPTLHISTSLSHCSQCRLCHFFPPLPTLRVNTSPSRDSLCRLHPLLPLLITPSIPSLYLKAHPLPTIK